MIIPINTDAPVYHFPFAALVLIAVNAIAFALTGFGSIDEYDRWGPWSLQYGQGLNPIQWVTSNFIHMGFSHLIGNMAFLWGFALVVEGKLGWWKFLVVFFGIGIVECAIEQAVMLGHKPSEEWSQLQQELQGNQPQAAPAAAAADDPNANAADDPNADAADDPNADVGDGFDEADEEALVVSEEDDEIGPPGSCGASAIIFGMLALALVWAPKNEMTFFTILGFRPMTFEVTIWFFCTWKIALEILVVALTGLAAGPALLHSLGAVIGFGLGTLMVKQKWVDCETWDLFSVLSGKYGSYARDKYGFTLEEDGATSKKTSKKSSAPSAPKKKVQGKVSKSKEQLAHIGEQIEKGAYPQAAEDLYKLQMREPQAQLPQPQLKVLAVGLAKRKLWADAVPLMEEYVERFPETAIAVRLQLAGILLQARKRPKQAIKILKPIDTSKLTPEQTANFQKIAKLAKQQIAQGVTDSENEFE